MMKASIFFFFCLFSVSLFSSFNEVLFDEAKGRYVLDKKASRALFSSLIDQMNETEQKDHPEVFFWRASCLFCDKELFFDQNTLLSNIADFSFAKKYAIKEELYTSAKMRLSISKWVLSISEKTEGSHKKTRALKALREAIDKGKDIANDSKNLKEWMESKYGKIASRVHRAKSKLKANKAAKSRTQDIKDFDEDLDDDEE